ncbi:MAG: efflux RND transporter periplasmic adaptor subunit [Planctomycetes bacterium]|nr:efflux RND transporter periplasmic adaptor subunit [Planctomycetota bacterium]MCW8134559.1 efflux RND transporter periplasmic adaptor subunit [Planctomycetota bacterium]
MPPAPDNSLARRNVVAGPIELRPLEVKITLPVVTRPIEELEIRAAVPGRLVSMPHDKGDQVKASNVPQAAWTAEDEFKAQHPAATEEQVALRNLSHLTGFAPFAMVDDSALVQGFREAQAMYDQAVRDLKRLREYPDTTGSQLDNARTRRDTARAAALRVMSQIEDTRICSPVSGLVTLRARKQGEYVNPGELIATVAVMRTIRADLELPETHFSAIKVGDSVAVTLRTLRDDKGATLVRNGIVARKDTVAHPQTHSFTVEIDLDNADLALPAGLFGTVEVVTYRRENALVVPLSAVKLNGPRKSLFVVKGDRVKEIPNIQIGQLSMEWAEILGDPVKPGERVVTSGAQWLGDGDLVNAMDKEPTA